MPARGNRLSEEKSPYLRQHKDNPIHWFAWGPEAQLIAEKEDKPIFLSVGYSTCYWCHMMDRETFQNQEVADYLNAYFISIKLDREERPDIDQIYMEASVALSGQGGWPMTVFMQPDGKPFFAATYFPRDRFMELLQRVHQAWVEKRRDVAASAEKLAGHITNSVRPPSQDGVVGVAEIDRAFDELKERFDPQWGGFGKAPKFPPALQVGFLLRYFAKSGNTLVVEMVRTTLEAMARGGIYDQLGGGFSRYSVDHTWTVPHFEKMLYDNALLAVTYLEAYQVSSLDMFRDVGTATLDFVLRDLAAPESGFYSALDAGEAGCEGEFYAWSETELRGLLTTEEFKAFSEYFVVDAQGNFEAGRIVLRVQPAAQWEARASDLMRSASAKLFAARSARPAVFRDEKIIAAWNGLMISALCKGSQVTGDWRYVEAAKRCAKFMERELFRHGRLVRRSCDGEAALPGCLEDYAFVIEGLLHLYETEFDEQWLNFAVELQKVQDELLWDTQHGGYFFSVAGDLLVQRVETLDQALPAGNSVAALNNLRLYGFFHDEQYRQRAEAVFRRVSDAVRRYPSGHARLLSALDYQLSKPTEIAIVDGSFGGRDAFVSALHQAFLPNKVLAAAEPDQSSLPLLAGRRPTGDNTTVFVCSSHSCLAPITSLEELRRTLRLPALR